MKCFLEIDYSIEIKEGQKIAGDVVFLNRLPNEERNVCILSDGLGSGIKANVLATITGKMAQKYVVNNLDITHAAKIIMNTLPVCKERKISYATFTICDISQEGAARIIEYDNPSYQLYRKGKEIKPEKISIQLDRERAFKKEELFYSEPPLIPGDRLIFFSDGVTQAGLGSKLYPLGWRERNVRNFIEMLLDKNPNMSARELAKKVTSKAKILDNGKAGDDITATVIYFRHPRKLLVVTGPPMNKDYDKEMIQRIDQFPGKKIIAGGTTANIASRELNRKVTINIKQRSKDIPPTSDMEGIDLITEGMLTLNKVAEILENRDEKSLTENHGAARFATLLINSDHVTFLVGTRVNEAHQDPSIPFEIGIRRSIVRRILQALETNYLKETHFEFI